MIKVLFFGPVAERMGTGRLSIEHCPNLRLDTLREDLRARYPEAFALVSIAAIDGAHMHDASVELADGCEVVFMTKLLRRLRCQTAYGFSKWTSRRTRKYGP